MIDPVKKFEIINHILEFSAGLLQVAQPTYAVKILGIGSRIMETAEKEEWSEKIKQENITNKENILILLGPCARRSPLLSLLARSRILLWDTIGDH